MGVGTTNNLSCNSSFFWVDKLTFLISFLGMADTDANCFRLLATKLKRLRMMQCFKSTRGSTASDGRKITNLKWKLSGTLTKLRWKQLFLIQMFIHRNIPMSNRIANLPTPGWVLKNHRLIHRKKQGQSNPSVVGEMTCFVILNLTWNKKTPYQLKQKARASVCFRLTPQRSVKNSRYTVKPGHQITLVRKKYSK